MYPWYARHREGRGVRLTRQLEQSLLYWKTPALSRGLDVCLELEDLLDIDLLTNFQMVVFRKQTSHNVITGHVLW